MDCNKSNLDYKEINFNGKPLFIFINHKVSLICWNKIKEMVGKCDVITFDSHRDFRNGVIFDFDNPKNKVFASKHHKFPHPHFTKCGEFIEWNLLDNEKNNSIMGQVNKYLTILNDNFIDVAFMKDIIKDVFWYYRKTDNNLDEGKCEDINDSIHNYYPRKITFFKMPPNKFILDIDLDFFVNNPGWGDCSLLSITQIRRYVQLLKEIIVHPNCIGITIALEPGCCGGKDNCLKILRELSNKIGINLQKKIENYLG